MTIHANLPALTAFIIFTGHSDPRKMAALNTRKAQFETALRSGKAPEDVEVKWTSADGRDLEEAVELARRGLLFLGVKY
jgi:RNA exonuclease 1